MNREPTLSWRVEIIILAFAACSAVACALVARSLGDEANLFWMMMYGFMTRRAMRRSALAAASSPETNR